MKPYPMTPTLPKHVHRKELRRENITSGWTAYPLAWQPLPAQSVKASPSARCTPHLSTAGGDMLGRWLPHLASECWTVGLSTVACLLTCPIPPPIIFTSASATNPSVIMIYIDL